MLYKCRIISIYTNDEQYTLKQFQQNKMKPNHEVQTASLHRYACVRVGV